MRTALTSMVLCATSLLQGSEQGSPAPESPQPAPEGTTAEERAARDLVGLQARLEGDESAREFETRFLERLEEVLSSHEGQGFVPSTVGAVKRNELEFLSAWHMPQADRAGAVPADDFASPAQLPAHLRSCSATLAELGIEFLVVPIPLRLQVYPEHLKGVTLPQGFEGYGAGMTRTLQSLAQGGVEVLDLLPLYMAERDRQVEQDDPRLYLDYDLHWTPRGARLAADAVAERLRSADWFVPGPSREGEDFLVRREEGTWSVARNRKLELEVAKDPFPVWYDRIVRPRGQRAHTKDRLSPILLMGDSFSGLFHSESADMASLLFARLGYRIDVIGIPGGGAALWKSLRRRGREGLEGKRVIIWMCSILEFQREFEPRPLFPR
jgi:hypothetical protein